MITTKNSNKKSCLFHCISTQAAGNKSTEVCPFNAKHLVKRSEFRLHIASCPDRNRLGYEQMLSMQVKKYFHINSARIYSSMLTLIHSSILMMMMMIAHIITELPVGGVAADDKNNNSKNAHCSSAVETTSHRESSANTECEDWDAGK